MCARRYIDSSDEEYHDRPINRRLRQKIAAKERDSRDRPYKEGQGRKFSGNNQPKVPVNNAPARKLTEAEALEGLNRETDAAKKNDLPIDLLNPNKNLKRATLRQHLDFVEKNVDELDQNDIEAMLQDDEEIQVVEEIGVTTPSPTRTILNHFADFDGDGSVNPERVNFLFSLRNWLPPHRMPAIQERSTGYTSPITIMGEIMPIMPVMAGNQQCIEWQFVPVVVKGKYKPDMWKKQGVANYRGHFAYMYVWVRYSSVLLNLAHAGKDKEWLQRCATTVGCAASPDGNTWGYVLAVKTPHVKSMLDLVIRNPSFIEAYTTGKRPIVAFSECVFSYNKNTDGPQFQTTYPSGNRPGDRTDIVWVGNYKDLPNGIASQMATQASQSLGLLPSQNEDVN